MFRYSGGHAEKGGKPPGSLVYLGKPGTEEIEFRLTRYNRESCEELLTTDLDACLGWREPGKSTWIHVNGLHDAHVIGSLGRHFNVEPLILEDLLNTAHRPKLEEYDDFLFVVLKIITRDGSERGFAVRQFSMILGPGFVLSFQESGEDIFGSLGKRLRNPASRVRRMAEDYLVYALMDTVVDHLFLVTEGMDERIEAAEEGILLDPSGANLTTIHSLKYEVILLRRFLLPIRDVTGRIGKADCPLIADETLIYLRDVHDHALHIVENIETCREITNTLLETYHSSVSSRINEVMQVLTIISTIFIPLSFLAGVYGTNFKYIPELEWRWGYPMFWGIVLFVGILMLVYFKKRKWL